MLRWGVLGIFAFSVSSLFVQSVHGAETSESASATTLTVSTLNIKFYGYESSIQLASQETRFSDPRNNSLRKYIDKHLGSSDVIAFQEIIDVTGFKRNVLQGKFSCRSYGHENSNHLHVLICYKKKYKFIKSLGETNYIMEDSTLGRRLRPVVHGILATRAGKKLAYIAAVHLKANDTDSATRIEQMKIIAKNMKNNGAGLPKIILGDFNTHANDVSKINRVLRRARLGFSHTPNPNQYTYRVPEYNSKLDHFWATSQFSLQGSVKTSRICYDGSNVVSEYSNLEDYNREISDHCYLKATFKLQN